MKTIRVREETWKRLSMMKTEFQLRSMDKVVELLLEEYGTTTLVDSLAHQRGGK